MKCANPKCKNEGMQWNFIKVVKPGEEDVYYCSQKCFNRDNKVKLRYGRDYREERKHGKKQIKKGK